jgi:hypothetical protein
MPAIPEALRNAAVYLYPSVEAADRGRPGAGGGMGFLVQVAE